MSDLISRSALMKDFEDLENIALEQVNKYNPVYSRDEWRWWSAVLKERTAYKHDLMDAPTVDAVEVVRCKDCKWFNDMGCAIRIVDDSDKPKDNDYCSFGELKDEVIE